VDEARHGLNSTHDYIEQEEKYGTWFIAYIDLCAFHFRYAQ
jgi:hypothetical protein